MLLIANVSQRNTGILNDFVVHPLEVVCHSDIITCLLRATRKELDITWSCTESCHDGRFLNATSVISRSPTPCRFKHSHLASRVSEGERLVARVHAHPRSMGPKMDSLLYTILGSLLRNRFVLPLWDPTDRYLRAWKPVPS